MRSETGSNHNVSSSHNAGHPYQADSQSVTSKNSLHSQKLGSGGVFNNPSQREIGGSTFGFSAQTFRLKASNNNVNSPVVQASEIVVSTDISPLQQKRKENNKRRL